jgi:hypothetical protein
LLRGEATQVILRVRKHPKDLLQFLWDAVPSEVRDASLTLGRTDGVERDCGGAKASQVILRVRKHPKDLLLRMPRYSRHYKVGCGCFANARHDRGTRRGLRLDYSDYNIQEKSHKHATFP